MLQFSSPELMETQVSPQSQDEKRANQLLQDLLDSGSYTAEEITAMEMELIAAREKSSKIF